MPTDGTAPSGVEGPSVNWDNPANGVPVSSLSDVQSTLDFEVLIPEGLGNPVGVFTADEGVPRDGRFIEFVYEAGQGRVVVLQHPPDLPPDQWAKANEEMVQSQPSGGGEIVTIRGGEQAFVFSDPDGTKAGVYWLEGGTTEFWVGGPDLTAKQVLAIAEGI